MFLQYTHLHAISRYNFNVGLKLFNATNTLAQAITAEIANYGAKALQQSASACGKLADAKTLDAAIDIQGDHAKAALDDFLAQSKRMGKLCQSLAKDAAKSLEIALEQNPAKPTERNVREAVASAVKDAMNAARDAGPGVN